MANGAIAAAWLISLLALLPLDLTQPPPWLLLLAVLVRTVLQTGLFILGHDAMHGLLWPAQRRWNARCGAAALALYAALPYRRCWSNHRRHHRAPGSSGDPDFPSPQSLGIWGWYRQFMGGYLSRAQMAVLVAGWAALALGCSRLTPTAVLNVLLFCTLPLLLSSLQLFLFGTYLPHRSQRRPGPQAGPTSLDLPPWLSLLACFHFGYHREHHDNPGLTWLQLPAARRRSQAFTPA